MCDLATMKKSSCHGRVGKHIGPVKLSKWELPIPRSKSYWDGVCAEIEKKHKRVRDAYPSFSTLSAPSVRTQFHDDFKFKISPPTPMHKIQNDKLHDDNLSRDNSNVLINDEVNHDIIELPPAQTETRVKFEKTTKQKIFSKKSCPLHKNATSVKIFDDEISKYLKIDEGTSVPTLPDILAGGKLVCEHRKVSRSKSTSASSIRSRETPKSLIQERRVSKAPKLGTASLLPSFARPVSTDSSAGTTRSSFESEEELPKAQSQPDLNAILPRNLLRVPPNLSFVSSHPSFRKLSFVDSVDDGQASECITLNSELEYPFVKKRYDNENQTIKPQEVSKPTESTKVKKINEKKNMSDLEKEYSYKALEVLTRKTVEKKSDESCDKSSIISEVSSIPDVPKFKKLMRSLDKESSIDFSEVRQKLKRLISKNRAEKSVSLDLNKTESKTIYSASRSTSSSSPDFESKAIEIPSTDALERIPETKVFHRAYIDKCHACLFKPFKSETNIRRELPLAKLMSVIKNPPEFRVASSSSNSTIEEIRVPPIYDYEDDISDFPEFEQADFSDNIYDTKEQEVKDHPRVSFDQSNLTTTETKDKSQSPKFQSEHHLKEKSFSIQSSDRSKTSTPSNQSSESDDARGPQDADKLPSSKCMAPCHAPVVLRKSLEPLRALKQKKFMSLKTRAAAITAKSSDGSESDSQEEDIEMKKPDETVEEENKEVKKKKKKKKKLVRIKSVTEKMTEFSSSIDVRDVKGKKLLKRAKTTFDLLDTSETSESEESSEEEISVESKETTDEKKQEQLPLVDLIVMHRAGSPPSPIMSTDDVIGVVKACLQKGDFNAANLLDNLNKEFVRRINERYERLKDSEDAKYLKLGHDLFNALIDSRRYLKPYTFNPNLKFSHKQPPLTNSRQLRRILPPSCFQLVAPILGMPKYAESTEIEDDSLSSKSSESVLTFDLEVHPPTSRDSGESRDKREVNPYALFLKKSRRKAVVWRPLREEDMKGYDPEATLEMRATRLMDRICKEFCDWVRQLGGNEQIIDEETLKDMFEINFTSDACKSTQVVIKEMPTVPLQVVKVRHCPEANELEATRKEMQEDLKVEARPKRTFAFGRSLPRELRFVPPRTRIATKWLDCKYIPKDLENMDVVWDDIGHLDSVQEFYNFLQDKKVLRSTKLLKNLEETVKNKA